MAMELNCPRAGWAIQSRPDRINGEWNAVDPTWSGLVAEQISSMMSSQRNALERVEQLLALEPSDDCIGALRDQLAMVRKCFESVGVSLYERIILALSLSHDASADATAKRVVAAFGTMLDLLIDDLEAALSLKELCTAALAVINWVDDAPISLEMWLGGTGVDRADTHVVGVFRRWDVVVRGPSDGAREVTPHAERGKVRTAYTSGDSGGYRSHKSAYAA